MDVGAAARALARCAAPPPRSVQSVDQRMRLKCGSGFRKLRTCSSHISRTCHKPTSSRYSFMQTEATPRVLRPKNARFSDAGPALAYSRSWAFASSVLASFRASSTANSRMYAVTERPAERARRDNRSTSRAMPSAFVAGSCRQNSTSLAMTSTHATGNRLLKFTPNERTSQTR
jgi:hypothetical protein